MLFTNGKDTIEVKNDVQKSAFINSGWIEIKEKPKASKTKKNEK